MSNNSIADKLAKLKQKQIKVEKPEPQPPTQQEEVKSSIGKISIAGLKKPATTASSTKISVAAPEKSEALSGLLTRTSNMVDQVTNHLEQQEAKGLYNVVGTDDLDGFDADAFVGTLRNLDAATVEKTPDIRQFSRSIRKNLEQYPELMHILSDDQLGIICSGVLTLANVETAPKTKAAQNKQAKKKIEDLGSMKVDDLFGM